MEAKKCMWCLTEFNTNSNEKFCCIKCEKKNEATSSNKTKKGFAAVLGDLTANLFS